jgi:hypothetical protein
MALGLFWFLICYWVANAMATAYLVGRPREPIGAAEAAGSHIASNPHLHGRTVYGVRVVLDPLMRFGEMELK